MAVRLKVGLAAVVILFVGMIFGMLLYDFEMKSAVAGRATSRRGTDDRISDQDLRLAFVPDLISFSDAPWPSSKT